MANATVNELRRKNEATWQNLGRQLEGMDHLLFEPGWKPAALLERFAVTDLPVVDITPGVATVTPDRRRMTLGELTGALDAQRREAFAYLETLGEADLARKARIPLFKEIIGTDEITPPIFVGAIFDRHWSAHAEQLAKIRQAAGLPETK